MKYRILVAGYLVRCPLGGYAWQVAQYVLGLQRLGHDVWFYEDTAYYSPAYNPVTNAVDTIYDYGVAVAQKFFSALDLGSRWIFVDVARGQRYGAQAGDVDALFRDADLVINLGGVHDLAAADRVTRRAIYIDLDPGVTQIGLDSGHPHLRRLLEAHHSLFTFGENIGTPRSALPTGGYVWHPTRQPIVIELWAQHTPPPVAYTTVGKWSSADRDLTYRGEVFQWRKRTEWLRFLDLPARTDAIFEMAMDVRSIEGDLDLLTSHGWRVVDPLAISIDPWRYRKYLRCSRGEFTVAKDMNVRLRSGWFSDRSACYLAAGRPVVTQDTGFGDVLPLGPGLHAVRTVAEAADAVRHIEADYDQAGRRAFETAAECFAAEKVLRRLLQDAGF